MKKIFYLLTAACMMVACNDTIKDGNGTEPTGLSVQSEGTAGAKVTVIGQDIAKDAKFYLADSENRTELNAEILESGAEVTLPYTLGEFTLYVDQDGSSYAVGKITVAITGIVLPEEASIGEEITITANGFAADAAIFLGDVDANAVLEGTVFTLAVPAEVSLGETTVTVKQAGTEQELGKINVKEGKKLITRFCADMMGDVFMDFEIKYDSSSRPVTFVDNTYGFPLEYTISTTDDISYAFNGEMAAWTFKVENNRVAEIEYEGESFPWEYDTNGHLTTFWVDEVDSYPTDYDADGNYGYGFLYDNKSMVNKPDAIDIQAAFALIGSDIYDNPFIYAAAAMLGWAGTPSTNLPTGLDGAGDCSYEFDSNGYVTLMSIEGMINFTCSYAE